MTALDAVKRPARSFALLVRESTACHVISGHVLCPLFAGATVARSGTTDVPSRTSTQVGEQRGTLHETSFFQSAGIAIYLDYMNLRHLADVLLLARQGSPTAPVALPECRYTALSERGHIRVALRMESGGFHRSHTWPQLVQFRPNSPKYALAFSPNPATKTKVRALAARREDR